MYHSTNKNILTLTNIYIYNSYWTETNQKTQIMNSEEINKIAEEILQISRQYAAKDEREFLEKVANTLKHGSVEKNPTTAKLLKVFAHRRVQYEKTFNKAAQCFE